MSDYPHVRAAFINAIAEEGTKEEAVEYLQKQWNENCALRSEIEAMKEDISNLTASLAGEVNENERLTKDRDYLAAQYTKSCQIIDRIATERDEARAQVAGAYQAAAKALEDRKYGDPDERAEHIFDAALDKGIVAIRALTPTHAKAALEAYGREKVREGMHLGADIALQYDTGEGAHDAILAEMEKEGDQ